MVKFPEATKRLFGNVFVCRKCKSKIRASYQKILSKTLTCKKCGCKSYRSIKKVAKK